MIPELIQTHMREQLQDHENLRVYVLVDGIQFHKYTSTAMQPHAGSVVALFAGTADERLAPAGPWLVDPARATGLARILAQMEPEHPGVVWLITSLEFDRQLETLRAKIDACLPDGRKFMVRFWDPRALLALHRSLGRDKWHAHFGDVLEWHFIHDGKQTYINNHA